jgi:hypothetical protein
MTVLEEIDRLKASIKKIEARRTNIDNQYEIWNKARDNAHRDKRAHDKITKNTLLPANVVEKWYSDIMDVIDIEFDYTDTKETFLELDREKTALDSLLNTVPDRPYLLELPAELQLIIFRLAKTSLHNLELVCKQFQGLILDPANHLNQLRCLNRLKGPLVRFATIPLPFKELTNTLVSGNDGHLWIQSGMYSYQVKLNKTGFEKYKTPYAQPKTKCKLAAVSPNGVMFYEYYHTGTILRVKDERVSKIITRPHAISIFAAISDHQLLISDYSAEYTICILDITTMSKTVIYSGRPLSDCHSTGIGFHAMIRDIFIDKSLYINYTTVVVPPVVAEPEKLIPEIIRWDRDQKSLRLKNTDSNIKIVKMGALCFTLQTGERTVVNTNILTDEDSIVDRYTIFNNRIAVIRKGVLYVY